jgi:hypothetical protein
MEVEPKKDEVTYEMRKLTEWKNDALLKETCYL